MLRLVSCARLFAITSGGTVWSHEPGFRGTVARILAAPIRLLYCQLGVNYVPHLRNRLPVTTDIDRAITAAAELLD